MNTQTKKKQKDGESRPLEALVSTKNGGCTCQSCGNKYKVDVMVSDEVWDKIKPDNKSSGEGLLCGSCIMMKIEEQDKYNAYNLQLIE